MQQFIRAIYNQRTCEWANIDNIEMHTQIDIPKIKTCSCNYNAKKNTKMAQFDLEKNDIVFKKYIKKNNFQKLKSTATISKDSFKTENGKAFQNTSSLYFTKGTYKTETWQILLDTTSGKLWILINYEK